MKKYPAVACFFLFFIIFLFSSSVNVFSGYEESKTLAPALNVNKAQVLHAFYSDSGIIRDSSNAHAEILKILHEAWAELPGNEQKRLLEDFNYFSVETFQNPEELFAAITPFFNALSAYGQLTAKAVKDRFSAVPDVASGIYKSKWTFDPSFFRRAGDWEKKLRAFFASAISDKISDKDFSFVIKSIAAETGEEPY